MQPPEGSPDIRGRIGDGGAGDIPYPWEELKKNKIKKRLIYPKIERWTRASPRAGLPRERGRKWGDIAGVGGGGQNNRLLERNPIYLSNSEGASGSFEGSSK